MFKDLIGIQFDTKVNYLIINCSKALRIGFISFNLSNLDKGY